jgi:hypothetical protein
MVIGTSVLLCPKCKRKYDVHIKDVFKDVDFNDEHNDDKDNDIPTNCLDCGTKLVPVEYEKYFDNKGEFIVASKNIALKDDEAYKIYNENVVPYLRTIKVCLDNPMVLIEGNLDIDKKHVPCYTDGILVQDEFVSHIFVRCATSNKIYNLFDVELDRISKLDIGERYNSFYGELLYSKLEKMVVFFKSILSKEGFVVKAKVSTSIPDSMIKYNN